MTTEDKKLPENYLLLSEVDEKMVEADIHWHLKTPHKAGHLIGQLIQSLVRTFELANPGASREQITVEILDGMGCMLNDRFLDGDDSNVKGNTLTGYSGTTH